MRPVVVVHYMGMVLLLTGAFMPVPALVSLVYQEGDFPAFLISAVVTLAAGAAMWVGTRDKQPGAMLRKESFLVVALSWALVSAFGSLPYLIAGTFSSPLDAYFESISGFTTTGASLLSDIESQPHGVLFWRSMTQWLGGMGIIALFVALVPLTRVGSTGISALVEDEAPSPQVDRVTPRIRDTAKALWVIYSVFTALEVVLLLLAGMPLYDSMTHAFSTMATGGFSPRNASIAYYQSPTIDWIIIVFMTVGGANFGLYYVLWKGKVGRAIADTELRTYLAILAVCSLLVTTDLLLRGYYSTVGEALRFATFEIISQQTTTGFATADYDTWPWVSKLLILTVMFIGASSGSTGGGLKVIRLIVIAKYAHRQLYGVFQPRVVQPLKVAGRVVPEHLIRESVSFFIIYQSIFLFSTIALVALDLDFITALSGVAATIGTVGPGLGQVGPILNYSTMPDLAKLIFVFNMYVGRLELWTVLILFRTSFWREP